NAATGGSAGLRRGADARDGMLQFGDSRLVFSGPRLRDFATYRRMGQSAAKGGERMIRILLTLCALAIMVGAGPANAVLRNESLPTNDPVVAELATLKQRIEAGEAAATLPRLEVLVSEYERAADVWNMYGFALRHVRRYPESRAAYDRALALDPDH